MRWHLATNNQLEHLFNNESDLPNHLLVGLVEEMMSRNLFDGMVVRVASSLMRHYNKEEVMQIAHIGLFQMAQKFRPGEISFKRLAWIVIERRLKSLITHQRTKRNMLNQSALQFEVPVMVDSSNVEKAVIQKLTLQEQLEKLNEKEHYIVTQFLEGYSLNYLARHHFKKDAKLIHYHFEKALKKMGITDYKIGPRSAMKGA